MINNLFDYPLLTEADLNANVDFQALMAAHLTAGESEINNLSPRNRQKILYLIDKYIDKPAPQVEFVTAYPK